MAESDSLRDEIKNMVYPNTEEPEDEEDEEEVDEAGDSPSEEERGEEGVQEEVTEPAAEEPAPQEETLEQRYARLLEDYNKQAMELLELRGAEKQQTPPPPAAPQAKKAQFELDEKTLEQALVEDDKEAMKKIIHSLVQYIDARSDVEALKEAVLLEVPAIASQIAGTQVPLLMAVREFYRENSDLRPYSGIVGQIVNELQAKNPNQTLEELFSETEKEARKRLNLKKQAIAAKSDKPPAFAKTTGSRRPGAPKISGLRGEISEMLNARR